MQQYTMPQTFANPALPDLSAMMFPTADEPLGYPNQPLTTFENNQQYAKNNPYTTSQQAYSTVETANPLMQRPASRGRDDNIEAQFFALPPYIEQRQHQQRQQQQQAQAQAMGFPNGMAFNNGQQMNQQAAMQMQNDGNNWMQQAQNQGFGNINIQDIFGGTEWNPMLMGHGFQNQ